jgi:hypothetical protein
MFVDGMILQMMDFKNSTKKKKKKTRNNQQFKPNGRIQNQFTKIILSINPQQTC